MTDAGLQDACSTSAVRTRGRIYHCSKARARPGGAVGAGVVAAIVALALLAAPAAAQTQTPAGAAATAHSCPVNGCGPDGFFGMIVPNRLAGCRFKAACDAHDVCYSKCLPCHTFSNSPLCYGLDNKQARRTECDDDFKKRLLSDNPGSLVCRTASEAYYRAVRQFGNSSHRSIRPSNEKLTADRSAAFKRAFEAELARQPR